MVWVVTVEIWDVWKVVALIWGVRVVLSCAATWAVAPPDSDWRASAWRCEWRFIGYLVALVGSAATITLASSDHEPPAGLWLLVLALLGLLALLDLPSLVVLCHHRFGLSVRDRLRWRLFLLRLRRRQLARYGPRHALAAFPRVLLAWHRPWRDTLNAYHQSDT